MQKEVAKAVAKVEEVTEKVVRWEVRKVLLRKMAVVRAAGTLAAGKV